MLKDPKFFKHIVAMWPLSLGDVIDPDRQIDFNHDQIAF